MKQYFAKLSSTITRSTIWQAPMHIKIVWVTMLSLSDKDGNVTGSIPGLANLAVVSVEQCEDAINHLLAPDKYSRTKEHNGRRIEEIDGGWLILNYTKYRGETTEERKKRIDRERIAEKRQKATKSDTTRQSPMSPHTDTDTDTDPFPLANANGPIRDLSPSLGSNGSPDPDPLLASSSLELDLTNETSITKSKKTNIKKSKKKKKEPGTDSSRVFQEYAKSYEEVYGIKPPTSAKNYKHCQRVIERLGIDESLEVARYYPYCKNAWHVGRRHALAQLEHDCESIYTEYVTGDKMTQTKAREVDRLAKTADGWAETIRKYGE